MKLGGKVAVITGGGSGFGEGIAKLFSEHGASIVVADLNPEGGRRVVDEIVEGGGKAVFIKTDVSVNADAKTMIATAVSAFGRLDIVVNNAGFTHRNGPMLDVDEETFDRVYAVNVKSIYLAALHAVPLMRKAGGGAILNIASTAGVRPRPGLTWYNGSKGAAITLTRSMAVELAPDRIRVNALNPVAGETGMFSLFLGADTPERREKFLSTIPLGRFSKPLDIAKAALFLISDDAEFITGVCMEVDGGRCI